MSDSAIRVEVHLIQNFAPSNLNRDDTNQPKSTTFGGFRRARISSQCSKRSTRRLWREDGSVTVGERTKLLKAELAPQLAAKGRTDDQIGTAVNTFLAQFYSRMDGEETAVLLFLSQEEIGKCKELINKHWEKLSAGNTLEGNDAKGATSDLTKARTSADIALFGRMLAEQPGRNDDGACQVAHPISTHKVEMEMDFYTAVDDLNPKEKTGAGMMGVVGFNSACYYRYALVDRDQLARNLARKLERDKTNRKWRDTPQNNLTEKDFQEADKVIKAFLEAMVYAIPTGKQKSFAAQNLPSFGLFVVRKGGVPISLANAFAKPVRPTKDDDDLIGLSVAALTKHWSTLQSVYGEEGVKTTACFHIDQEGRLNGLKDSDKKTVKNAIDSVMEAMKGK